MKIGVDYYPEHWDKSMWVADADDMKAIGVNIVRLAEFAWCRMEPRENEFDFSWLDEAVKIFAAREIQVMLCTPTNTPPLWMFEKYPDMIKVDSTGHQISTGIRGHCCLNNKNYLERCKIIIEKLVEHYKDEPAVIGYQIDNELEANYCMCPACTEVFQRYEQDKYKTLEKVNEAYGNVVWSGEYSDFKQIKPPFGPYKNWLNPSYMLDFNKFASKSTVEFVNFQQALIRSIDSKALITTNTWLCENMPVFYDMYEKLDFVSYDNYPTSDIPKDEESIYSHGFHLDLMRGIKQKNFWIMEELSGPMGCWMPMTKTPRPGMIKGYSMQAIAHGADAVVHFRWRTAAAGAEMFWHGLIDAGNVKGRRYREFVELCNEIKKYPGLEGAVTKNKVAILYGSLQEYAFKIQLQSHQMSYFTQLKAYHDALTALGIGVDIINEFSELSGYELVIAPTIFIADPKVVNNFYSYVENGGHLVITTRSGIKDEYNRCFQTPIPGPFSKLVGVTVDEYDPIGGYENTPVWEKGYNVDNSELVRSSVWADILNVNTAEVICTYGGEFYSGRAAITKNNYGAGKAYYVGTLLNKAGMKALMKLVLGEADIPYIQGLPGGIECTRRYSEDREYLFVFNNTEKRQEFSFGGNGEMLNLEPFEMKIFENECQTE